MHAVFVESMHTCRFSRIVFCLFSVGYASVVYMYVCLGVVGYFASGVKTRKACRSAAREVFLGWLA
jgi:hypothetical protein